MNTTSSTCEYPTTCRSVNTKKIICFIILRIYYKDVTQKYNADNRLENGISKDIVADAIRDFGIKLYQNNFSNEDLYTAFLGLTPEGGLFPFPNITGSLPTPSGFEYIENFISASSDYMPLDDVNKSLYKRIYDNIFHLSEDQYEEYRDLVIEDQKRAFRNKQIAEEGNDPQETGRSYGTPHDLASLYGRNRYEDASVPQGYDEKAPLGRPEEKVSNINTQQNALGRDRLGRKDNKVDDQEGFGTPNYKGGSPLALETSKSVYAKNKTLLESLNKDIIFGKKSAGESLLDENNLTE